MVSVKNCEMKETAARKAHLGVPSILPSRRHSLPEEVQVLPRATESHSIGFVGLEPLGPHHLLVGLELTDEGRDGGSREDLLDALVVLVLGRAVRGLVGSRGVGEMKGCTGAEAARMISASTKAANE